MSKYRVIGHSDAFTIRDDVSGDVATFPITSSCGHHNRTSVQYIADKMNEAYYAGKRSTGRKRSSTLSRQRGHHEPYR